jgi:hypothetical protein
MQFHTIALILIEFLVLIILGLISLIEKRRRVALPVPVKIEQYE